MKIKNTELIKKWEKLKLEAYLPTPNDVWTIGWGHTHTAKKGMRISVEQAEELFLRDVDWVNRALKTYVKVPLNQNQYDALASLIFNIGETNFTRSTLLRKLNAKDYEGAAAEFPRWNKQKGKVLRGLVRRRAEEMEYFLQDPVEEPIPQALDNVDYRKPLTQSREAVGGAVAAFLGALATLLPENIDGAYTALSVALVGFGVFILWNRLRARKRGER
jgi:lysozyme